MTTDLPSIAAAASPRRKLGQILLDQARIRESQLNEALALQNQQPERLGSLLCCLGHVDPDGLREALVVQADVPKVDLESISISPEPLALVSAEMAFRLPPFLVGQLRGLTHGRDRGGGVGL